MKANYSGRQKTSIGVSFTTDTTDLSRGSAAFAPSARMCIWCAGSRKRAGCPATLEEDVRELHKDMQPQDLYKGDLSGGLALTAQSLAHCRFT
jgi:hypothetical protein